MISLKKLLEVVPFEKGADVSAGLKKKYGGEELDAYTFGIEFEFKPDTERKLNIAKVELELRNNRDFERDYLEFIENEKYRLNRRWNGELGDWDDSYGPPSEDEWIDKNPKPDKRDFETDEEYDESYNKWEDGYREIMRINKYYDIYDQMESYIDTVIENGEWEGYISDSDHLYDTDPNERTQEIYEAINFIKDVLKEQAAYSDVATENVWAVGIDGSNIEIRTRHLKQNENDFDLVREMCGFIKRKQTSGGTSAHIHIGLPKDFDAFDVLAMSTLVDEKAVKIAAGSDRELETWAKLRDSLHKYLITALLPGGGKIDVKSFALSNDKLLSIVKNASKYHGTNINAFSNHKTIEFRYLSSNIASQSELLLKWIRYFLILPKIAKSRNKILLSSTINNIIPMDLVAIREPGKVKFIVRNKDNLHIKNPELPAADIKQLASKPLSPLQQKLLNKKPVVTI